MLARAELSKSSCYRIIRDIDTYRGPNVSKLLNVAAAAAAAASNASPRPSSSADFALPAHGNAGKSQRHFILCVFESDM